MIAFLISLSVSSLLAHKNANDFWIWILYPATLLNSFVNSSIFLLESLGFSMYSIMSSTNKDSFTSSFPISIPFTSYCLMLWLGLPVLCWIREVKADIPVLFPILREILIDFHHWVMLAAGLSYMAFIMFRYVPSNITLLRVFIINGCQILSNVLSCGFYHLFCLCGESHLLICKCCTNFAFLE